MIELCVADSSTVLEPSAATSTTATCSGFFGSATFGAPIVAFAYRKQTRSRRCFCEDAGVKITQTT